MLIAYYYDPHFDDPKFSRNVPRRARYLGTLPDGTRVYRHTVVVHRNESTHLRTTLREIHEITAASPADAIEEVRARRDAPESEYFSWGPRGGRVHRYTGYESFIARKLAAL